MSFNIATSGLNAITEQLNAISNNIANSGTVGFKSGRAEFSSLYAESQPLGVGVSGVTQSITRGGNISTTGNALDLAISDSGFFMVRDSTGTTAYTRAGYFGTDSSGNLINNLGMYLQGYPVNANGEIEVGTIGNLTISSGSIPAKATDSLDFTANLDARAAEPETAPFNPKDSTSYNNTYTTQVFDSLGREHTLNQYFVKTGENTWQVHYYMDDVEIPDSSQAIEFTEQGVLKSPVGLTNLTTSISGAADLSIDLSYNGTSQYGSDFSVSKNNSSGYASGERTGQAIDEDGSVYATFSNGERMLQGQLVLANFANPNGLASKDGTTWVQTASSGAPLTGTPGTGLLGSVKSGALESSNVDLSKELVNMIVAQRNYQSNAQTIKTQDQILNTLVNLR